jgi:hypothetical protein
MVSRMRNLLKLNTRGKKAQFFVLSAFAIVAILFLISSWIQPYTIIDTSSVVMMQEPFVFNNLKEKAITTVSISKNCDDLTYNLDEYKNFISTYAAGKNLNLNFNYVIPSCTGLSSGTQLQIPMTMTLKSTQVYVNSSFTATWISP